MAHRRGWARSPSQEGHPAVRFHHIRGRACGGGESFLREYFREVAENTLHKRNESHRINHLAPGPTSAPGAASTAAATDSGVVPGPAKGTDSNTGGAAAPEITLSPGPAGAPETAAPGIATVSKDLPFGAGRIPVTLQRSGMPSRPRRSGVRRKQMATLDRCHRPPPRRPQSPSYRTIRAVGIAKWPAANTVKSR